MNLQQLREDQLGGHLGGKAGRLPQPSILCIFLEGFPLTVGKIRLIAMNEPDWVAAFLDPATDTEETFN